jgi:hypothetical protein
MAAIAEAKQRSQRSVIGFTYNLEVLRASEGMLICWSWLYLQSLAPAPVSRRVGIRLAVNRKNNCLIFITT